MSAAPTRAPNTTLVVGLWCGLLAVAVLVGQAFARSRPIEVGAVPWVGQWGFDPGLLGRLGVAGIALAGAAWFFPRLAVTASWPRVLGAAALATSVLAVLLAWAGPEDTHWPGLQFGYAAHTHLVDDWHGPAEFLRVYVARMPELTAHLRAHPPGLVLALWSAGRLGLAGIDFHLGLMLAAGAVCTVSALVVVRDLVGEVIARAAAPFVVLGPVLVWRTNSDVLFAAAGLGAVAVLVIATGRRGWAGDAAALAGGVLAGVALLLSFGVMLLALPVVAVAIHRRRVRPLIVGGIAAIAVLALPAVWGYSWLAGLAETRRQYDASIAHVRGYRYWLLGNAAIYAALLGPAVAVALTRVKADALRVVVWSGFACAVAAGLSGLSSAETERIWQPFVPLVLTAGAALWCRDDRLDVAAAQRWLGLQALTAMVFQTFLWTRV